MKFTVPLLLIITTFVANRCLDLWGKKFRATLQDFLKNKKRSGQIKEAIRSKDVGNAESREQKGKKI